MENKVYSKKKTKDVETFSEKVKRKCKILGTTSYGRIRRRPANQNTTSDDELPRKHKKKHSAPFSKSLTELRQHVKVNAKHTLNSSCTVCKELSPIPKKKPLAPHNAVFIKEDHLIPANTQKIFECSIPTTTGEVLHAKSTKDFQIENLTDQWKRTKEPSTILPTKSSTEFEEDHMIPEIIEDNFEQSIPIIKNEMLHEMTANNLQTEERTDQLIKSKEPSMIPPTRSSIEIKEDDLIQCIPTDKDEVFHIKSVKDARAQKIKDQLKRGKDSSTISTASSSTESISVSGAGSGAVLSNLTNNSHKITPLSCNSKEWLGVYNKTKANSNSRNDSERLKIVEENQGIIINMLSLLLERTDTAKTDKALLQPLKGFPVKRLKDLKKLESDEMKETRMKLKEHFKYIGTCTNARQFIRSCLVVTMLPSVMLKISWFGQKNKLYGFGNTKVANAIFEAASELKLYPKGCGCISKFQYDVSEVLRAKKQTYNKTLQHTKEVGKSLKRSTDDQEEKMSEKDNFSTSSSLNEIFDESSESDDESD